MILNFGALNGESRGCLSGHSRAVKALLCHHDEILSGSDDGTLKIWDAISKTCLYTLHAGGKIASLVADRTTVAACVSGGRGVVVWDSQYWVERCRYKAHEVGDWGVLVLTKGGVLLVGSSRSTQLLAFDVHTGNDWNCYFGVANS